MDKNKSKVSAYICFILFLCCLSGCKREGQWLHGQWLLINEDGKPSLCFEFLKDGNYSGYGKWNCSGSPDPIISGRWELKKNSMLIQQRTERKANPALISDNTKERFIIRGALSGRFIRLPNKKDPATWTTFLERLEQEGTIKIKALPNDWGCRQLSRVYADLQKLPEVTKIGLRQKDLELDFRGEDVSTPASVEKLVYALNHEGIEYITFILSPEAFAQGSPKDNFSQMIGMPLEEAGSTQGQQIFMWKAYCAKLAGAENRDVDVTMFVTAAHKRARVLVSEGVLDDSWEDLKNALQENAEADALPPAPASAD